MEVHLLQDFGQCSILTSTLAGGTRLFERVFPFHERKVTGRWRIGELLLYELGLDRLLVSRRVQVHSELYRNYVCAACSSMDLHEWSSIT